MRSTVVEEETYVDSGPVAVPVTRTRGTARLTVQSGDLLGESFEVGLGSTVLGRGVKADIRLSDHGLSRRHARIVRAPDGTCKIEDLRSTNGTFVNERRIEVDVLRDGDRIKLAGVELTYESRAPLDESGETKATDRASMLAGYRRTLSVREHQFGPRHPALAPMLRKIGRALVDSGDIRGAIEVYRRAKTIYEALPGEPPPELAPICVRLGEAHLKIGQAGNAKEPLVSAERMLAERPPGDRDLARARFALARVRWADGDRSAARQLAVLARDGFAAAGRKGRSDRDRVSDWIIAHGG